MFMLAPLEQGGGVGCAGWLGWRLSAGMLSGCVSIGSSPSSACSFGSSSSPPFGLKFKFMPPSKNHEQERCPCYRCWRARRDHAPFPTTRMRRLISAHPAISAHIRDHLLEVRSHRERVNREFRLRQWLFLVRGLPATLRALTESRPPLLVRAIPKQFAAILMKPRSSY